MSVFDPYRSAADIAADVREGRASAQAVTQAFLDRIASVNPKVNAFTDVTLERALQEASDIDATRNEGGDLGPLAGVPFAVKNLFDLEGRTTRAGSLIRRDAPLAPADADLVARLKQAGAICLGALNMGEFAYDFTGENAHDGACHNPHDLMCMTGGSSSGSGAAVAAGLAPFTLGSDTNGSLRVPASLCGVYSLKPTYGRLTRGGSFPFVDSLDHVGPVGRTAADLTMIYGTLLGSPGRDHGCHSPPGDVFTDPKTMTMEGLRVGILRGWFEENSDAVALERQDRVLRQLRSDITLSDVVLDEAAIGRAAAYLITNAESAAFHLPRLRERAGDFDPDTRDRFLAGALLPAAWIQQAQRVRHWWLSKALEAFSQVDLLLVPATPCTAPKLGQKTLVVGGEEKPLRPILGLLAQPFSCIGLPVVTAPVFDDGEMPMGLQIVGPPWREDRALAFAQFIESLGLSKAHQPAGLAA